jgi:Zn-dependent protease with chaperone function
MRVALLAAMVGLAAAAAAYAACAVLARTLVRSAVRHGGTAALAARVLPVAGALLAALALVVPAFLVHEPERAVERPGVAAALLSAAGLLLAGSLARRAFRAWRATRRMLQEWERSAEPLAMASVPAPTFGIVHPFPVVAVVGVLRPRLFVARSVLRALTPGELQAVLEHEAAHIRARDNFKRWLLACAPSIGWRRTALALERAWEGAAEQDADRGAQGALDLASALVKTARLAPHGAHLRVPAAAFHGGGDIARRVQDLVSGRPAASTRRSAFVTFLLAAGGALVAAAPLLWPTVYRWAEALIHLP